MVQTTITTQNNSRKMLFSMTIIGLICAILIVGTYQSTFSRIETLKNAALEAAIYRVLPGITHIKSFEITGDSQTGSNKEIATNSIVFAGYDDKGVLIGLATTAQAKGYADVIKLLYGYDPYSETIIGFYVLESKETPGLGDKIEKDERFLANFKSLSVALDETRQQPKAEITTVKQGQKNHPWEIDGITGATISSRAVGAALAEASRSVIPLMYQKHKDFETP